MSTLWFWLPALLITNLATGLLVALRVSRLHQHTFDPWSKWLMDVDRPVYGEVCAVRYHICRVCNHVERQITGNHRCHLARINKPCPHLDYLNEPRITELERELGIDGSEA